MARKEKLSKGQAAPETTAAVYADRQRHVALQLVRTTGGQEPVVEFIRLNVEDGLDTETAPAKKFDKEFTELLVDYPPDRAARLMIGYARSIGATEEALRKLGKLFPITEEDITMATAKKAARAKTKAKADPAAAKEGKPAAAKKTKKPAGTKPEGKARLKGESASQMFQELIRQGAMTDDQIFSKVKAKFNLDESKRGYVGWYRNYMRKNGEKVPDPK